MSIISAGGAVTGSGGPAGPDPRDYFNTVLYTGNNTTNSITGVGFQPDWVWIKRRDAAQTFSNGVFDAVRGRAASLITNLTTAEQTSAADKDLTAFTSDGFNLGQSNNVSVNDNTGTYVAWCWKANGAGSTNTDGTTSATVSANIDSGFSVITATTPASFTAHTVGHGLGVTPAFIIYKERNQTSNWQCWHRSLSGATNLIQLNTTTGEQPGAFWGTHTSTVVACGGGIQSATSSPLVMYVFAETSGFSKISSYTGNGSATGPSVTTDFEPTWILIKRTDSTGDWIIHDSARDASNPRTAFLEPNTADAEGSGLDVDFNSTGFQIKSSSATVNANGGNYIYMCFA